MKKLLTILLLSAIGCRPETTKPKSQYLYRVNYPVGGGIWRDYTDSYEIVDGGIKYVNEHSDSVFRMGSLFVTKNK